MVEDDDKEDYSLDPSTIATMNACFKAFDSNNKCFLDSRISLHIIRIK